MLHLTEGSFDVVMRDGFRLTLPPQECGAPTSGWGRSAGTAQSSISRWPPLSRQANLDLSDREPVNKVAVE